MQRSQVRKWFIESKTEALYTGNIRLIRSENWIENIKGQSIQLENWIKNIKGVEHFKWSVSEYFGIKRPLSLKNENISYYIISNFLLVWTNTTYHARESNAAVIAFMIPPVDPILLNCFGVIYGQIGLNPV